MYLLKVCFDLMNMLMIVESFFVFIIYGLKIVLLKRNCFGLNDVRFDNIWILFILDWLVEKVDNVRN